jgi:hypothetical protein
MVRECVKVANFSLPKLALPPGTAVKRKPGQSFAVLIGTKSLFFETLNIVACASSLDDLNDEPLKNAIALNWRNMAWDRFIYGYKQFVEAKGDKIFRGDLRALKFVYALDTASLAAALGVDADRLLRWLAVGKSDWDVLPLTWQKLTAAVLQLVKDRIQTDKYSEDEILKRFKIFIDKDSRKYFS